MLGSFLMQRQHPRFITITPPAVVAPEDKDRAVSPGQAADGRLRAIDVLYGVVLQRQRSAERQFLRLRYGQRYAQQQQHTQAQQSIPFMHGFGPFQVKVEGHLAPFL